MNLMLKLITGSFIILLIFSCESHEKKADDAFDQFKEEKKILHDSEILTNEIIPAEKKEITVKKVDKTDDWTKLKNEIDKRTQTIENSISRIKSDGATDSKTLKKLTYLEDENNKLKKQLDEYIISMKLKLEQFKTKIIQDTQDLEAELKVVVISNKK
ncbi:MAG: hypothetical protein Q7W45_07770 [Bacteroidota bacterium]|nr:hypothetical protein [Bacteroidota bacterium]